MVAEMDVVLVGAVTKLALTLEEEFIEVDQVQELVVEFMAVELIHPG